MVEDHDSGRLVWVKVGREKHTVAAFFDALGPDRCAQVRLVSADAADWIGDIAGQRCPQAIRCMDPFHVTAWATKALDDIRRETWNDARRAGRRAIAKQLNGALPAPRARRKKLRGTAAFHEQQRGETRCPSGAGPGQETSSDTSQ